MKTFSYIIQDEQGLHARPVGLLVKTAAGCTSETVLSSKGKSADMKKILGLMSLGVKKNDQITVEVTGENEEADAAVLEDFIKKNL